MKTLWKSIDQKKTERIIIAVLVILVFTVFCCKDVAITMRDKALAYSEEVRAEEQEKMEGEVMELKVRLQQEISSHKMDIPEEDLDAASVARVLYGFRYYNLSDTAKEAIIDVILNRVACSYGEFGNDIHDVCAKEAQWQGYDDNGCYMKADYELAYAKLHGNSSARSIPENCYWVVAEDGAVCVRTSFTVTSSTNSWRVE